MISREDAIKILDTVKNENLKKHMKAVASIMEEMADKLGEDRDVWWLTGLLHDIDYEIADYNEHGKISAEMLEGKLPKYALHAIKAHNDRTGFYPENKIDYALIACDAISGLIVASALVMPNKKVSEVKIETLKNKFKDKSFARKVDRKRIMEYEKIGIPFDDFLSLALEGVKKISDELDL